jgi:hypothetical protein
MEDLLGFFLAYETNDIEPRKAGVAKERKKKHTMVAVINCIAWFVVCHNGEHRD